MTDINRTERRTANHKAAANSPPVELAKDVGSKHPAHQADHAHMAADFRKRFWISLVFDPGDAQKIDAQRISSKP